MMLLGLALSLCSPGPYHDACQKSIEAGSKQTGIYQNVDKAENVATDKGYHLISQYTGDESLAVAGAAAKIYRDKAITYKFAPHVLLIDNVTTKVDQHGTGSVGLQWRF